MAENELNYVTISIVLIGAIILLCVYTNILFTIFAIGIWLAIIVMVIMYLFRDFITCQNRLKKMANKVEKDVENLGLWFMFKELVDPKVDKLRQEQLKYKSLLTKSFNQSATFLVSFILITLVYLSPVMAAIFSFIVCLGFLTKPDLGSLDENEETESIYFDLFVLSGAILTKPGGNTKTFIGAAYKWIEL